MANEITYRGKLAFLKGGDWARFDFGELTANMAGTKAYRGRQTCSTTEEALILGELVAARAWVIFKNMDATNSFFVKATTTGFKVIEVLPGETAGPFRFGSGITAPFVEASAATVDFIYLLISA